VRCLYCGKSSWLPFKKRTDGEFCSRAHRDSYQERLRKVANVLEHYDIAPQEAERATIDPAAAAALVSRPELREPLMSELFRILTCEPAPAAANARTAPAIPPVFEISARIRRWGLKIRFLKAS
jgi:hypothetical protein